MKHRYLAALAVACVVALLWSFGAAAETCSASYYCCSFHGRTTASGERFDQHAMTAARPSRAHLGKRYRVTNLANGRAVIVRVNDVGPVARLHRCMDLSLAAARHIGMLRSGVARVSIERVR